MRHFEPFPLGYFQIDWKKFGEMVKIVREENDLSLRGFTLLQVMGLPFQIPEEVTKAA
jgi:hypothetical protein